MKISTKLTLIFSIFIFLSYTAIFFILSTVTESNFKLVSHDVHYRTMDTMYEIVETELSQLEVLLNDWANWDASYDFVKGDYPENVEYTLPFEVYLTI